MYYCNKCKRVVEGATWECETPNHKFRQVGEPSSNPFYHEVRCEICGSDDLEETRDCECCGEPAVEEYCDWCMDEAQSAARHFAKGNIKRVILLQDACEKLWEEMYLEEKK